MFNFSDLNTNAGGGLQGPFINWQARAGQHAPAETWTLRAKDDAGATTVHNVTEQFQNGVVFDYNTIKLGWEKWAPMGQQSTTVWAPTPNLAAFPRPDESKRTNEMGREVFNWGKAFAVRIAVSPKTAATWNQNAFGAALGFERFVDQLKVAGPQHPGKLPLVKFTGVTEGYGGAKVPTLTIADWKDAPDCLREQVAATLNAGPGSTPPPVAAATAQATAQTQVDSGHSF